MLVIMMHISLKYLFLSILSLPIFNSEYLKININMKLAIFASLVAGTAAFVGPQTTPSVST